MIDLDDSNYIPQPVEISEIDVSQVIDEPVDYISERKFVICESQLDKLLKRMFCPECADNSVSIKKTISGTSVGVKIRCSNDHDVLDWCSQPQIGKFYSFNLLLCASIVFSGINIFITKIVHSQNLLPQNITVAKMGDFIFR